MRKILLTLILGIFLISLASAEIQTLGTFKLGDDINLIQTCSNCTFNNITSVLIPNSTQIIGEFDMTKVGTVYNFTLSSGNATQLGEYIVAGFGDLDGVNTVWNYNFFLTPSGADRINQGEGITLFGIIIILVLITIFFIIGTIFISNIPFKVFLGSMSVLMLVSTIGFGVTIMQQLFGTNTILIAGFTLFFRVFVILLGGAAAALILYLVVVSLTAFNRSRGLIE